MDGGDHSTAVRPLLLDLFCGGGGAALGYYRAGFDVVGIDMVPQADYPFPLHVGNALREDLMELGSFDAIHASPPCQTHTSATGISMAYRADRLFDPHADLIGVTRELLVATGVPYVIENVPGAPLVSPITLCGSSFGLEVVRHRRFELGGWDAGDPPPCLDCKGSIRDGRAISVYGHGGGRMDGRRGMRGRFEGMTVRESYQRALGIDHIWSVHQLAESIPPAYTQWIGERLLEHLSQVSAPL